MQAKKTLLALSAGLFCASSQVSAITLEELAARLGKLEKENTELRILLHKTSDQAQNNASAVEVIADNVDNSGMVKASKWFNKTTIGAYGELHYNNLSGKGGADDKDEMDFHRFVLFVGHEFSDDVRFWSEIELEHSIAGDGQSGEIEIEQAFIDFDLNDNHTARAGLFLIPVGTVNANHIPTVFYGTERNPIEKNIIPTTWWEGGAGLYGQLGKGFSYDAYIHSGLEVSAGKKFTVRKGRQKVSKAEANDLAATGRLRYTGIAGLELAVTAQHQQDITQVADDGADSANMIETHAIWSTGPFTLKALYAMWDIEGTAVKAIGADKQEGFYIESSFKVRHDIGIFARFNQWDNQAGNSVEDSEKEQWDIGVNWWPHENVVIKADYQYQNNSNGKDQNGLNVGLGYTF
jgi:opacity protein-like surface antigen